MPRLCVWIPPFRAAPLPSLTSRPPSLPLIHTFSTSFPSCRAPLLPIAALPPPPSATPATRATLTPSPPTPPSPPLSPPSPSPSRRVAVLSLDVVQRIAAGEVVHSLRCVVQELVENALDACATHISVDLDLRARAVTVTDDGCGVSPAAGLRDVARCNATSKLRTAAELRGGVPTLGFRGQGLWAVAAKAEAVYFASRTADAVCGTEVTFGGGGEVVEGSEGAVGMAVGTVVRVDGLPWGGGKDAVEFRECKAWMVRVALCYPRVRFCLTRSGKVCWGRTGGGVAAMAMELKRAPEDFRSVERAVVEGVGEVDVVAGLPSAVHVASRAWMVAAVNGRCVRMDFASQFAGLFCLPKSRFPVLFVNVSTEQRNVDWNMSPQKTYCRFKSADMERRLLDAIPRIVEDLLHGVTRPWSTTAMGLCERVPQPFAGNSKIIKSLLGGLPDQREGQLLLRGGDNAGKESRRESPILPSSIRVVVQLLNTYILVEHEGGVLLVEQHVADERILYENLCRDWKETKFVEPREPIKLSNSTSDEDVFFLTSLGFDVESVSGAENNTVRNPYIIRCVPKFLSSVPATVLATLLLRASRQGESIEKAAASIACNLATKNGTKLREAKMNTIVSNLLTCRNPHVCPHGRPIFVELRTRDLAKLFGRSWMPERFSQSGQQAAVTTPSGPFLGIGVLPE